MKEQTQQPGVRKWAGDDMIALQAEPLSAIQHFFEEYGNCIIQGCTTTPATGGKFNIAPGLLGLSGMDADGLATFKVVPFSGVENVTLPLYFTLTHSVVDRVYGDGKVKPIAYDYRAAVSAVRPAAGVEFLELTPAGGRRFVDAVKITEKLDKTGNGRDVTVTFAQAATRENIASGEKLTTVLGKIVRWLADLKALAFKDKVSKADMDAALQGELNGKLNLSGGTLTAPLYVNYPASDIKARFAKTGSNDAAVIGLNNANDAALCFLKISREDVNYNNGFAECKMWHSGNFNPATKLSQLNDIKDANNVSENGAGKTYDYTANIPARGLGGYLVNYVWDANAGHQMFFSYVDSGCFVRRKIEGVWNSWRKVAEISDIPVSLPANGGNADTVGNFAPASFFVANRGTFSKSEINNFVSRGSGTYRVDYSSGSELLTVFKGHGSASSLEFLHNYIMGSGAIRVRSTIDSNRYSPWQTLAFTSDIPASLPAKGGNADTVGGSPAWRLQSVGEDLVPFGTNAYNVQSRFNAKKDGRFRLEIVSADSSDHRDKVSVGHADLANNADTVGGKHASDFLLKSGDQTMQGNLTLNTPNQSYVAFSRNGTKGYVGLIAGGYTHVFLSNEASGANLRADDNGKNYSNNKEIATLDQIKVLSGGAAATAGLYVSGITVNDHAITVTKEALPTSDRGSVNNRDWNTILEPGSYNTSPQLWGTNNPAGVYQYGLLTVQCSGNSVVQTYCESNYATMNYRVKSTGSSFSAWTQVAKKENIPTTTAQLTEVANKKFVTDAEKEKLGELLNVMCAGVVSGDGGVMKKRGSFKATILTPNRITITHNLGHTNYIVNSMFESGENARCYMVEANSFVIGVESTNTNTKFVMYII